MDLDSLRTFCTIAQHKSFRKASDILKLTQPAVSRRIQSLEEEIGKPLFLRTQRNVILTAQGKEFLTYAERAIQIVQEGLEKIGEANDEKLIIAGSPTTCMNLLPGVVKEFYKRHNIPVSVFLASANQVYDRLIDQTIDVGFTTAVNSSSLLTYEATYMEEVICVAHPDLAKAYLIDNTIVKQPLPVISNIIKHPPWDVIYYNFFNNPLFKVSFESDSFRVTEKLARIGAGFALLPISDAKEGLAAGELVHVSLPNFDLPKRAVYIVTYRHKQIKKTLSQFKKLAKRMLLEPLE